jgi:hypothetical protein
VSVIIIGTLGYALLGLACVAVAMRTRRGTGNYTISRNVKVSYGKLPLRERIRTSNALVALGAALLLCATFSLLPTPVMVVFFLTALCLFVLYVVSQRDLRRAAQEIARTEPG